jgi:hypothetical protein
MDNYQELEERKENIYRYPYIDLHDILQRIQGKRNHQENQKGRLVACKQGERCKRIEEYK